jgi:predicted kinase
VVRVNRDDLRRMMHGGFLGLNWAERQVSLAQYAQIEALLRHAVNVICDDSNLQPSVVRRLVRLATACGAEVVIRDFTDVSVEECIARDASRDEGERVGPDVIRRMWRQYLSGSSPR